MGNNFCNAFGNENSEGEVMEAIMSDWKKYTEKMDGILNYEQFKEAVQSTGVLREILNVDDILSNMKEKEGDDLLCYIFNLFDENGDGKLIEKEFITGVSILLNGSMSQRMKLLSRLHFSEGDDNDDVKLVTKDMAFAFVNVIFVSYTKIAKAMQRMKEKKVYDIVGSSVDDSSDEPLENPPNLALSTNLSKQKIESYFESRFLYEMSKPEHLYGFIDQMFKHYQKIDQISVKELKAYLMLHYELYQTNLESCLFAEDDTDTLSTTETAINEEEIEGVDDIQEHELPDKFEVNNNPLYVINSRYYIALKEGKIWIKSRPHKIKSTNKFKEFLNWTLLPPDGLPHNDANEWNYPTTKYLTSIGTDGWNLIATSESGVMYYNRLMMNNGKSFVWQGKWGKPFADWLKMPPKGSYKCWAVSHRGKDSSFFEDPNGTKHISSVGVTTLYVLTDCGKYITYVDPWLPPTFFSYQIPMPMRGRFIAEYMSAAGSLITVINKAGEIYSRIADYDTIGDNPALKYTYQFYNPKHLHLVNVEDSKSSSAPTVVPLMKLFRKQFSSIIGIKEIETITALPPEDWRKQPTIPGHIHIETITALQTGEGNSNREIRIEGICDQKLGFFHKMVNEIKWKFEPYQKQPSNLSTYENRFVDASKMPCTIDPSILYSPSRDHLYCSKVNNVIEVRLLDFNSQSFPVQGQIVIRNQEKGTGEYIIPMELHARRATVVKFDSKPRPTGKQMLEEDTSLPKYKYRGMLILSKTIYNKSLPEYVQKSVIALFGSLQSRENTEVVKTGSTSIIMIPVRVIYSSRQKTVTITEKYLTQYPQMYISLGSNFSWIFKCQNTN